MNIAVPPHASFVLNRLANAGFSAYLVGGCVRDSLRGKTPEDWDVTTDALPAQVIAALAGVRVLEAGLRHGTVTALVDGGAVEITTFRVDGDYSDGRRPDSVVFTRNLPADLARRDFTVNSLAYAPATGLIDLYGGADDIAAGVLRAVGEPGKRFAEDALRILRGLRFAATLGFSIEPQTAAALVERRALLAQISAERLFSELTRLVCGAWVDAVLREYHAVLRIIVPALPPPDGLLARVSPTPILRLSMLLRHLSPPDADTALLRLRCDNATRRAIVRLLTEQSAPLVADAPFLRRLLNRMGEPLVRDLLEIKSALGEDIAACSAALDRALQVGGCRTLATLALGGDDLAALGYVGAEIGAALRLLLDAVIDERIPNEQEAGIRWLRGRGDARAVDEK